MSTRTLLVAIGLALITLPLAAENEVVAETEALRLSVDRDTLSFTVRDLRTGYDWESAVPESNPAFVDANRLWRNNMRSLFTFGYVDRDDDRGVKRLSSALAEKHEASFVALPDGVSIEVFFVDLKIGLSIELTLAEDQLVVRIPEESIREDTSIAFTNVAVLPFFCAATSADQGYMFLPDGSGALYRFTATQSRAMADEKRLSWHVYSPAEVNFELYYERTMDEIRNAYMPVFGIKLGNSAITGIVDEGDTDVFINFAESGSAVEMNRIAPEFVLRHSYELYLSDISVHGTYSESGVAPVRYEADPISVDRTVRYVFLHDEEATYSGMAGAYRDFLRREGVLEKRLEPGRVPVGLSLFGGIIEDRLLFDKYVAMTTFDQARTILSSFVEAGLSDLYVNLIGWTSAGFGKYPVTWPPERALGGRSDLRRLADFATTSGIPLYLQVNTIDALKGNGRFNGRLDVAKQGNSLAVTSPFKDRFLLNPTVARERLARLLGRLKGYGLRGITFQRIGEILYQDYDQRNPNQRYGTLEIWKEMMQDSLDAFGGVALAGGLIHLAAKADLLFDIPMEGSGFIVIEEEVPFYEMVVHGTVHYTTQPANLFHDTRKQHLKWIEYGCVPYYMLTYQSSKLLAYTEYNHLFTSLYEDWLEICVEHYEEFNRNFGAFYHLEMVDHARIGDQAARVGYADGSRIYINYGETPVEIDGVTVPSEDYVVRPGPVSAQENNR